MTFRCLTDGYVLKICGKLPIKQAAKFYWYQALSLLGLLQQPQNAEVAEETQQEAAHQTESKDGKQPCSWVLEAERK